MANLMRGGLVAVVIAAAAGGAYVYTPGAWNKLQTEGRPFQVQRATDVRYGYGTTWVYKNSFSGAGRCTANFFQADPLPGVTRRCETKYGPPTPIGDTGGPTVHNKGVAVAASGTWPTLPNGVGSSTQDIAADNQYVGTAPNIYSPTNWEAGGEQRTACNQTKFAFVDPIVYPGDPLGSHLHTFAGNASVDEQTTAANIRTRGTLAGSCLGGNVNLSGYWIPTMLNMVGAGGTEGVPIEEKWLVYYKAGTWPYIGVNGRYDNGNKIPPDQLTELPLGLRMIAGDATKTSPGNPVGYICMWRDGPTLEADPATGLVADGTYIPRFCPVSRPFPGNETADPTHPMAVRRHIGFRQCWNGQLDSPNHRDHLADFLSGTTGPYLGTQQFDGDRPYRCPAGFPYVLTHIEMLTDTRPSSTTGSSKYILASDVYGIGPDNKINPARRAGYSGHADWFNGWDPAVVHRWMSHCESIFERRNCGTGGLGDGFHLTPNHGNDGTYVPNAPP